MLHKLYACLFLFVLLCLHTACEPTSSQGKWIAKDKQLFLKYCQKARQYKNIKLSKQQIDQVCQCTLQKAIKAYESFEAANNDAISKVGGQCIDQITQRWKISR